MRNRLLNKFIATRDGSATVEFVVVFLGFISIIMFVVEVTLYMFFTASLEKAAEAGVRAAVVSPPVVAGYPTTTGLRAGGGGVFGQMCSLASAPCAALPTSTCTGGSCQSVPFNRILTHMRGFNAQIQASNVTVTYADAGIGFAGGPAVPMVTVTVSNVPYQTGILGLLLNSTGNVATLPTRSAGMTGEDLAL
jgi:Flp pilus assembly protein TadG